MKSYKQLTDQPFLTTEKSKERKHKKKVKDNMIIISNVWRNDLNNDR